MLKASFKLVLITIGCLMVGFFAVVALRWMGLQQGFLEPSHPWFQRAFWAIYTPTAEELCKQENLDAKLPEKGWIVAVPVKRLGQEEDWVIPCAKPLRLADFLAKTTHPDFLLIVQAHDTWSLDKLVEIASHYDGSKHFAVSAEAQKVSLYLRKKAPQWLFAADPASLLRLRTFTSMYMESTMDFWPDFVISNFSPQDALQIDSQMAAELQRRKKRLLWNWNENASEDPRVPIQGILTNRPSAAQQKWSSRL